MPAATSQFAQTYGGIGIILFGAKNTVISLSDVENNVSQAGSVITGGDGIVLLDGALFGSAPPTGNSIRLNLLSGNGVRQRPRLARAELSVPYFVTVSDAVVA